MSNHHPVNDNIIEILSDDDDDSIQVIVDLTRSDIADSDFVDLSNDVVVNLYSSEDESINDDDDDNDDNDNAVCFKEDGDNHNRNEPRNNATTNPLSLRANKITANKHNESMKKSNNNSYAATSTTLTFTRNPLQHQSNAIFASNSARKRIAVAAKTTTTTTTTASALTTPNRTTAITTGRTESGNRKRPLNGSPPIRMTTKVSSPSCSGDAPAIKAATVTKAFCNATENRTNDHVRPNSINKSSSSSCRIQLRHDRESPSTKVEEKRNKPNRKIQASSTDDDHTSTSPIRRSGRNLFKQQSLVKYFRHSNRDEEQNVNNKTDIRSNCSRTGNKNNIIAIRSSERNGNYESTATTTAVQQGMIHPQNQHRQNGAPSDTAVNPHKPQQQIIIRSPKQQTVALQSNTSKGVIINITPALRSTNQMNDSTKVIAKQEPIVSARAKAKFNRNEKIKDNKTNDSDEHEMNTCSQSTKLSANSNISMSQSSNETQRSHDASYGMHDTTESDSNDEDFVLNECSQSTTTTTSMTERNESKIVKVSNQQKRSSRTNSHIVKTEGTEQRNLRPRKHKTDDRFLSPKSTCSSSGISTSRDRNSNVVPTPEEIRAHFTEARDIVTQILGKVNDNDGNDKCTSTTNNLNVEAETPPKRNLRPRIHKMDYKNLSSPSTCCGSNSSTTSGRNSNMNTPEQMKAHVAGACDNITGLLMNTSHYDEHSYNRSNRSADQVPRNIIKTRSTLQEKTQNPKKRPIQTTHDSTKSMEVSQTTINDLETINNKNDGSRKRLKIDEFESCRSDSKPVSLDKLDCRLSTTTEMNDTFKSQPPQPNKNPICSTSNMDGDDNEHELSKTRISETYIHGTDDTKTTNKTTKSCIKNSNDWIKVNFFVPARNSNYQCYYDLDNIIMQLEQGKTTTAKD